VIIKRPQSWGELRYDTSAHRFLCVVKDTQELPFIRQPVVLNVDLTFKCNLSCRHCVARDMQTVMPDDLCISSRLLKSINDSPFMVVVITGGEPLLPEYGESLSSLVEGIRDKGIIVDSNGTNPLSEQLLRLLRSKEVMVRISLDALRAQDETCLRGVFPPSGRPTVRSKKRSIEAYMTKIATINALRSAGVRVSIQSVLHANNRVSLLKLPEVLKHWGIDQLYVQRLIPTASLKNQYCLDGEKYEETLDAIEAECRRLGVDCISKRDRRHNCVFLLVGNGEVFTQGEKPGEKIRLGRLKDMKRYYFDFVSSSEHSWRYYGNAIVPKDKRTNGVRRQKRRKS